VLEQVAETIFRYNMFERGHTVGVAVSGGADSVCLLHVLAELAPRWALRLRVLHLNHCLRGQESIDDVRFVSEMAARLGLEFDVQETDVGLLRDKNGENLEQLARRIRRQFFHGLLEAGLVNRVALGHTRSDQAETVLFRILRGCGTTGLAGILPVTGEGLVRPLLDVDRKAVERFLRERGIPWREDASNQDPAFARNRIRHELLPALTESWNPSLADSLAHMATLVQDEERHWDREIERVASRVLVRRGPALLVRSSDLRSLELPVAKRLLRRAVRDVKGDLLGIEFKHIEGIVGLAGQTGGEGGGEIPGVELRRSFDWIRLAPKRAEGADRDCGFRIELAVPGKILLPGTGSSFAIEVSEGQRAGSAGLDGDRLPGRLAVRSWRPGDRYRPVGHARPVSCKTLFQKHKVPSWDRRYWPMIASGDTIVWARLFGPAFEYAANSLTRRVLIVTEARDLHANGNPAEDLQRLNE
jgi:tRNA(Ile)-lysidine synthase